VTVRLRILVLALAPPVALALTGAVAACGSSFTDTSTVDATPDAADDRSVVTPETGAPDVDTRDVALDTAPAPRSFLYAFVSSQEHIGRFPPTAGGSAVNGLAGAGAFCKQLGDASAFPQLHGLQWVAWLSVSGQKEAWRQLPRSNGTTTLAAEYRLRDGVTVVLPKGVLFEATTVDGGPVLPRPLNGIVLDDQAAGARTNLAVWTGTTADMLAHPAHCDDWNGDPDAGASGLLGSTSDVATWSQSGDLGAPSCETAHNVYCFEVP
jgi:hypothetical protein